MRYVCITSLQQHLIIPIEYVSEKNNYLIYEPQVHLHKNQPNEQVPSPIVATTTKGVHEGGFSSSRRPHDGCHFLRPKLTLQLVRNGHGKIVAAIGFPSRNWSNNLNQGLVNVAFWGFWTSPKQISVGDYIHNTWVIFNWDTYQPL